MIEEEKLAEEYVKSVIDVNAFDWKIVREICLAYLTGLKAGKPKWHKVADGDLPDTERKVLVFMWDSYYLGYYKQYDGEDSSWHFEDFDEESEQVIAWCEIPKYTEE